MPRKAKLSLGAHGFFLARVRKRRGRHAGDRPHVNRCYVPVPARATVCGLAPPLSLILSVAFRLPLARGVNVTLKVQFDPGATLLPHVFVWAKSFESSPERRTWEMLNALDPRLVKVTVWAELVVPTSWLPKLRLAGVRLTAVPTPMSDTVCGLPLALSVMVIAAVRVPVPVGVKVTVMVQFAPAVKLDPQVFVSAKSAVFTPVTPILLIANGAVPLFESVTT
jgi:hypothetical protein